MGSLTRQSDGLTDQEKLACQNYMKCFDYTEAWKSVNPDKSTSPYAYQYAWKFFQRPAIKAHLKALAESTLEQAEIDTNKIVRDLKAIVELSPLDFMEVDSDGEPRLDLSELKNKPHLARLLNISFGVSVSKDGGRIPTYKVEGYDKMEAMEKLIKLHGLAKGMNFTGVQNIVIENVNFPVPGQYRKQDQPAVTDYIDADEI